MYNLPMSVNDLLSSNVCDNSRVGATQHSSGSSANSYSGYMSLSSFVNLNSIYHCSTFKSKLVSSDSDLVTLWDLKAFSLRSYHDLAHNIPLRAADINKLSTEPRLVNVIPKREMIGVLMNKNYFYSKVLSSMYRMECYCYSSDSSISEEGSEEITAFLAIDDPHVDLAKEAPTPGSKPIQVSTVSDFIKGSFDGNSLITLPTYPFIGPRYLNSRFDFNSERISIAKMVAYYTSIKGGNVHIMPYVRKLPFVDTMYTLPRRKFFGRHPSYVYPVDLEEGHNFNFSFYAPGYFTHLPCKSWMLTHPKDDRIHFVRNEIDCVGYSGISRFNELEETLIHKCIKAQNILPSLTFVPRNPIHCEPFFNVFRVDSEYNFLLLHATDNFESDDEHQIFVQISDYDALNLARSDFTLSGLDYFIGQKGLVMDTQSYLSYSQLLKMDGYRFWYWMYHPYSLPYDSKHFDDYFAGSALRDKRRENLFVNNEIETFFDPSLFNEFSHIQIQGGAFSSMGNVFTSVNEIGKLAKTANGLKGTLDEYTQQPWFQTLMHYVTSVAQNIAGIIQDFNDFKSNPMEYIKSILVGCKHDFSFPENFVYDSTKTGLVLAVAVYLFEKSEIFSVGLFLFGYHSFFKGCYTDQRYARSAAIITTLVSIGVLKTTQLRPVSIELQAGGTSTLSSMIYAMSAFITMGFAGRGISTSSSGVIKHLINNTKDIFALSRGTLALSKCVEFIVESIQVACQYVFGNNFAYATLVKMTVTSKDLQEYIQYCLTTQPEELAIKLTLDYSARQQWDKICTLHKDLIKVFASGKPPTETHIGYSMYVRASTAFSKLRLEYDKIRDSLDHFRPEPFMVWIWGKPGTGKTWCRDRFVNNMYRWHSTIDPTLPDVKRTGLLYVRNPADKFMSKYNGEFGLAYDDVGQNRQQDNPEFNEIMGFGSTNQVRLNMADLEDKGRLFSSKVVIMAANSKNVVANNLILKDDAFNRRRHVVVEVIRPLTDKAELSTSKCDFSKVRLSLTDPITGDDLISFPSEGYGEDNETFNKLFEWLAPRYVKHVEEQNRGLEEKEKALSAVLNGEKDPAIIDIPGYDTVDLPTLDPILDKRMGKFRRIARLAEYDEDFQLIIDGIRNCYSDGMAEPTPLLTSEFNAMCREYDFEGLSDDEWKFLKDNSKELTPEELKSVQTLWDEQMGKMEKSHPWVTLLKTAGLVLSGFAMYKLCKNFFSGKENLFELQGYTESPKAPKTTPVIIQDTFTPPRDIQTQSYSIETRAPKTNKVCIQSSQLMDIEEPVSNIDMVVANLSKSMARLCTYREEIAKYSFVNAFNVCYNAWLIPRHFFGSEIKDTEVRIERSGCPRENIVIYARDVRHYIKINDLGEEEPSDFCIVRIPHLPHGRNHLKHFATNKQLESCRNFTGELLCWDSVNNRVRTARVGEAIRWDVPMALDTVEKSTLYYSRGYKFNFETHLGDCGSVLVSRDTTTPSRIYGIHFAYDSNEKRALSANLPRELVTYLVGTVIPVVDQINLNEPEVELQCADIPEFLIDPDTQNPYFEYLGYVKDGPLPPRDHGDLHYSPMYDDVYPAEKDLSVLHKYDSRMDPEFRGDPDILVRGVKDFAYESKPWPATELDIARTALRSEFNAFTDHIGKRVLTLDEAINGIWNDGTRLEYSEPINLKTSAGYGLTGVKRDHFITEEIKDISGKLLKVEHRIGTQKLQKQVLKMWHYWYKGETYSIPWSHTLKIEPIKLSKIKNGNTRTFCVASTAFLLNTRRLFGAFTAAMKASKIKSFSCLGVDANSVDWNDLYNNLRKTGPQGADMDFFKFDRTAVTWQLARVVCEEINAWYDDGEENARARIIAFEEMIFAYGLINKYLTRKQRGNPSGNPLTTELNNCVNYLMLCMVYLLVAKTKSPESYSLKSWKQNVNVKTYGDDIIFTLHPECAEWFDFSMLTEIYKQYGVPVTPADKSDDGIVLRPLHELTFLKRNFRRYDHPVVKWQSALSQTSIKNMIQFYRLKPNNGTMMEAVMVNCHESLVEAHHWGREFFDAHLATINSWLKAHDHPLLYETFDSLDHIYRTKLDG
ncbi:hypothetical protein [Eotetranychus kankitus picorna-like virus]|nr:hypothetical protein [Eotetranychus kankitus picorna-like virus]